MSILLYSLAGKDELSVTEEQSLTCLLPGNLYTGITCTKKNIYLILQCLWTNLQDKIIFCAIKILIYPI